MKIFFRADFPNSINAGFECCKDNININSLRQKWVQPHKYFLGSLESHLSLIKGGYPFNAENIINSPEITFLLYPGGDNDAVLQTNAIHRRTVQVSAKIEDACLGNDACIIIYFKSKVKAAACRRKIVL